MKRLVQDKSLVVAALRESSHLILSSDGKKVRRIRPLPITEVKDAKSCTVVVENLPEDCSMEKLKMIFGDVGNVKSVCIRDPHVTEDSSKASREVMAVSGKIHALVEFETVKEAEKAVATLNDEKSWRNGMRVELLLRRMGKYGSVKKAWKVVSEKSDKVPASHIVGDAQSVSTLDHHDERPGKVRDHRDERPGKVRDHRDERPGKSLDHHDERLGKVRDHHDERPGKVRDHRDERPGKVRDHRDERPGKLLDHHDERHGKEEGNHSLDEKAGRSRRSRGRGQFRVQKQNNANGHGLGSAPTGSRSEGFSKPPPGPRMPDGTRGFTMGRGRPPPPSNPNHE
ncbi:La-related protein [Thalictrum thalictroides]|uniref:La-related protein n=1 Tax=Thalictrum thalictroides TaxID=46969 RepID=A0A7J6XF41_THATH|nr:La-related protein [Thalictrum thalictroides]